MIRYSIFFILFSLLIPSYGFSSGELDIPAVTEKQVQSDPHFQKMISMRSSGSKKRQTLSEEMKKLRETALEEVATRVGFQEGYLWRYKQILNILTMRESALDSIFDFGPLLLHQRTVMPPVITQADAYTELKNPNEMVRTGTSYKILKPAKLITVDPSWRDYLLIPEGAIRVEKIHAAMLPTDDDEQEVWEKAVTENWFNGIEHANKMFQVGVNKLLVDLRGIILYKMLEEQGYISVPKFARGHLAIRVGDENLEMDQEVFRIVEKSKFSKK